jgi:hypothetical protein
MSTVPKRARLTACVALIALLGVGMPTGCGKKSDTRAVPWKSGTTVIPGTYGWDVETDAIVNPLMSTAADFWWEQVSETERHLRLMHGIGAAVVTNRSYEQIGPEFLHHRRFLQGRIDGLNEQGALAPNTIIVFRTAHGTLGKLQVVRYRPLHDLSFPEAMVYDDGWKSAALQRPDVEQYHIEVKWALFRPNAD